MQNEWGTNKIKKFSICLKNTFLHGELKIQILILYLSSSMGELCVLGAQADPDIEENKKMQLFLLENVWIKLKACKDHEDFLFDFLLLPEVLITDYFFRVNFSRRKYEYEVFIYRYHQLTVLANS